MSFANGNGPRPQGQGRSNPFGRDTMSSPPAHRSTNSASALSYPSSPAQSSQNPPAQTLARTDSRRLRSGSARNSMYASGGTFAPNFIKAEETSDHAQPEGGNDFSGRRYVWLRDGERIFVQAQVIEEKQGNILKVKREDGSEEEVDAGSVDKVNPAKFDRVSDMAELTYLNEPSVVHNLHTRYQADLIYSYSGLFLVAVNPYCSLPIYGRDYINMYKGRSRDETKPHIFAVADEAFRNLVDEAQNQSILVTGESGAGKTENTKKVIQYLAAVATSDSPPTTRSTSRASAKQPSNLSQQILRANPILEAFGNAQTVRNNNSSRFGKFIRIHFTRSGQISGAQIDWYLLEKSRVVRISGQERNYHIFYQLIRGADNATKRSLLLEGLDVQDFEYTKYGNESIAGMSDQEEWNNLLEAFHIMGMSDQEQHSILRSVAAVLHLGNMQVSRESLRGDQASFGAEAIAHADKVCRLLGIAREPFIGALLHPKVKAGREWVTKVQTPEQVRFSIDALAKGIYERTFGDLVDRINRQLSHTNAAVDDTYFIGVLDIAGFEIFQNNSFEQLCINYTNEKLQQFFNHHMFVLEQEEYAREQIEWKFIDFGKDLQPTIDLIEVTNPIGVFSCLDEDSVMPKATDETFTDKLHSLWDRKNPKYRRSMLRKGFMLTHYAAEVEYSTDGWLEKNKDPMNDSVTRLLAVSSVKHFSHMFEDCAEPGDELQASKARVKKGLFRTVAQRHKEQLSSLMAQLHSTHPHFVRCILPNHKKRPKLFDFNLVLDQLRCNGVLEGIRIARNGFPNRLPFAEFRSRYEVLCQSMPRGFLDGQDATKIILEKLNMDPAYYRVGLTKVFFRAGVLAELEDQRDALIRDIMSRFQSAARGFTQRRAIHKRLYRAEAARIINNNFQVYLQLQANPWWKLFVRMRPLLGATRQSAELKKRDEVIEQLEQKMQQDLMSRQALEDERRRIDNEMAKVQQTLESERTLALDKEEIFRRLQDRETELSEKLAGALDDQEGLEDQIDGLMEATQVAESKLSKLRAELDQAGSFIASLEEEKTGLKQQIDTLTQQLHELESKRSQTSEAEENLQQEIRMLTSQVGMKDRKISDLESKVVKVDQDLEVKYLSTTKDLQAAKSKVTQLSSDNSVMRQQLSEATSTSSQYEDLLRLRESELSILKKEKQGFDSSRQHFEEESRKLSARHDNIQTRLRELQGELEASNSLQTRLEREAADAKKLLEARLSEDKQTSNDRKVLTDQIDDLKTQLYQVQKDLGRERQSRDDVQMLGEHKYASLKQDFDSLKEAKITIEKELYVQQDILRRTSEQRTAAERERQERQDELRILRQRFLELQEEKLQVDTSLKKDSSRLAVEAQQNLQRELDARDDHIEELEADYNRASEEVRKLKQIITDSDMYKVHNDQDKERLERELVTIKGRLTASENDNRALLNKVQQKNLDIARSNSKASDSQRSRMAQLQADVTKHVEETRTLTRQLEDAKLTINSLEKQKEKLTLSLEDMSHEISREHKASRTAEKNSSSVGLQLAEANRKLETERQLRSQAQVNSRTIQSGLDQAQQEIKGYHDQLLLLQKVFSPNSAVPPASFDAAKVDLDKTINLAKQLEEAEREARLATERYARAEAQNETLRNRFEDEVSQLDTRHSASKRALLEELDNNQVHTRLSPQPWRSGLENMRSLNNLSTPPPINRHISNTSDSARSDKTIDSQMYNHKMDLAGELELLQNQLQMSEMRNKHLQSQIDRSPSKPIWQDESPSTRRMSRLQQENSRLHDMLDDSAKKVSSLENSIRTGQLSLKEVQTKSHEELFDLINSQEQSRRSLLQVHNTAVADLADAKESFDALKQTRASLEVEVRDARSELDELKYLREQEEASRTQLLEEFSDLQAKLDTESSKILDAQSTLSMYKSRADEYYNKLEQAEISVLKASRAEQFAKSQCREAEDTCATIVSERKQLDTLVEDLQKQVQSFEERVEDMSADLGSALQAKKRLQNELEDYRSRRAIDIEDTESSLEQTRKKYQTEMSTLHSELESERQHAMSMRDENSRLRDQLEDLRSNWDEEVLNSSTWAKEKSRLEMTLETLTNSRDEAANAHSEAQTKIMTLMGQVRSLRGSLEDASTERDSIFKEKKSLEARLTETNERLDELSRSESPSMRNAAGMDKQMLKLKAELAQHQDIATAAVDKMRRSEALAQEVQKDITAEREANGKLHKEKAALDKSVKDLQLRLVDLETKGYSSASQDVRFLNSRIHELESQLEGLEDTRTKEARSVRHVDRTVKDLQSQIERRDKTNAQLSDDISKSRDKIERLLQTIDELQSSDSTNQLAAKRAERELREEKERALRLEREVEGWKGLRMERNELRRSGTYKAMSDMGGGIGSLRRRGEREGSVGVQSAQGPQRQSSLLSRFL